MIEMILLEVIKAMFCIRTRDLPAWFHGSLEIFMQDIGPYDGKRQKSSWFQFNFPCRQPVCLVAMLSVQSSGV